MNDANAAGGDHHDLRRAADFNTPQLQAAYADAATHGLTPPSWTALTAIYEQCLFLAKGSRHTVGHYIDTAVGEFRDRSWSAELTPEAGPGSGSGGGR